MNKLPIEPVGSFYRWCGVVSLNFLLYRVARGCLSLSSSEIPQIMNCSINRMQDFNKFSFHNSIYPCSLTMEEFTKWQIQVIAIDWGAHFRNNTSLENNNWESAEEYQVSHFSFLWVPLHHNIGESTLTMIVSKPPEITFFSPSIVSKGE